MRARRSLVAALLVAPMLLAACSGEVPTSPDGGSAPTTTSPAPTSSAPSSSAPTSSAPASPVVPSSGRPSPRSATAPPEGAATTPSSTAGSGSAGDEDGTAAGAGEGPSEQQAGGRCSTDHLHVAVGGVEGGGAAGSVHTAVLFSNTGATSCTLQGYPGVSLVTGDDGEQVGAAADRTGSDDAAAVELAPGDEASALLRVVQHGAYSADRCDPTDARGYRIYPPGETAAAFVAHEVTGCASDDAALLSVGPVTAGPPQG